MPKAFLIVFEKEMATLQQRQLLHDKLTSDKAVNAWWRYITNTYIIITETRITAEHVRDYVMGKIPDMHFLVLQINYNDYNGYLDQKAWDWIDNALRRV